MSTVDESPESASKDAGERSTKLLAATGVRNDETPDGATLDYKGKQLDFKGKQYGLWTTILTLVVAILGVVVTLLGFKTGNQSEDIDSLKGRIDSLQRINGDRAEELRTLEEEIALLRTQRDDAVSDRDAAQAALDEANARLEELEQEGDGDKPPDAPTADGGEVRSFVLPLSRSYNGSAVDLDAAAVREAGVDLRYESKDGQFALVATYGKTISTNIGVESPTRVQCRDAVDKRPLAQDDSWGSLAVNQQACIVSDYGMSLLTISSIAENGDVGITQVYWRID
ncbi:hypothetical protein ABC795_04250 [Blastococcus sp. HT6-30]|uniref:hypothetical protein n=1 Tax=Blastococcus sp. HT6-30 TaxID=3144843 RepID=UPI00321AF339